MITKTVLMMICLMGAICAFTGGILGVVLKIVFSLAFFPLGLLLNIIF